MDLHFLRDEWGLCVVCGHGDDRHAKTCELAGMLAELKRLQAFYDHAVAAHSLPDICCPDVTEEHLALKEKPRHLQGNDLMPYTFEEAPK